MDSNQQPEHVSIHPPVVSREEWREARVRLLAKEKEATRVVDSVSAERRRLPMVKLEKSYLFHSEAGPKTLAELFKGQSQLIIYHFMFDPEWESGCGGCTSLISSFGDISDLADRSTSFCLVSRAPLEKLLAYKAKKGWNVDWVSSFGSDFNYDFHASMDAAIAPVEYNYLSEAQLRAKGLDYTTEGEQHGMSVFFRIGEEVFHTYSTYARGCESLTETYRLLDLTPYGRQEDWEDSPAGWPQRPTYG